MFTRLLLGYDGSPDSRKALATALDLAHRYNASILAVSVVHLPDFADTRDEINGTLDDAKAFFGKFLDKAREVATSQGIAMETRILPGHPADTLVYTAEAEKCDLIIVGARGLTGVKRYLLGSVSEATVRHARCPVLVVKG